MNNTVLDEVSEKAKQAKMDIASYISLCVNSHEDLQKILEDDSEFIRRILIKNCRCGAAVLTNNISELKNPAIHARGCKYGQLFSLE